MARGFGMAVSLVTVPLALSYLGKEQYGFWSAITSLITWVVLFDFGIANGLVNSVAQAYGKDDPQAAGGYVSTAFFVLTAIALSLAILIAGVLHRVPWDSVFAVRGLVDHRLVEWSVAAAIAPVVIGMPLSVVRQIYAGYQKSYVANLFLMAGSLATLVGMVLGIRFGASLPGLIFVFGGAGLGVSLLNLLHIAKVEMPWLRPRLSLVSQRAMRRLLETSVPLFLFQLGALLVNNTQLVLLAHRSGLATVAEYSILMRLYALLGGLIILSTGSFVPSFREAFERGDHTWMRQGFKRMLALRMAMATGSAVILMIAGDWLLGIWLGDVEIRFGFPVWGALAVLMVATTWVTAFSDLLTIMDRIWIQIAFVLVNGLSTVGLTLWLAPQFQVLGAVVAFGFVTVSLLSWSLPLSARVILAVRSRTPTGSLSF